MSNFLSFTWQRKIHIICFQRFLCNNAYMTLRNCVHEQSPLKNPSLKEIRRMKVMKFLCWRNLGGYCPSRWMAWGVHMCACGFTRGFLWALERASKPDVCVFLFRGVCVCYKALQHPWCQRSHCATSSSAQQQKKTPPLPNTHTLYNQAC